MTNATRISRALELECKATEADRLWPDSPVIARNLRRAAAYQRRAVALALAA